MLLCSVLIRDLYSKEDESWIKVVLLGGLISTPHRLGFITVSALHISRRPSFGIISLQPILLF
jgi:hypothetical protein